jgi:hypothetical protein
LRSVFAGCRAGDTAESDSRHGERYLVHGHPLN